MLPNPIASSSMKRSRPKVRGSFADAFGRVLLTARRARGWSQQQLAETANIDRTYPSMLESGIREPKLSTFVRLAGALGQTPQALLTDTLAMQDRLAPKATESHAFR